MTSQRCEEPYDVLRQHYALRSTIAGQAPFENYHRKRRYVNAYIMSAVVQVLNFSPSLTTLIFIFHFPSASFSVFRFHCFGSSSSCLFAFQTVIMKFYQASALLVAAATLCIAHPERLTTESAKRELIGRGTDNCAAQIEARKADMLGEFIHRLLSLSSNSC